MIAAIYGHFEILKFLIQNGCKFLKTDNMKKGPLTYAVINGHLHVASYLLRIGSDFNAPDTSKNTPLHYACAYGRYEMIDLLVQSGADPNLLNNWGYSPILVALVKGHKRCVEKMANIEAIDVNVRDEKGRGFLFGLVFDFTRKNYELLKKLIEERGGNPNQKDLAGNQLLHQLAQVNLQKKMLKSKKYLISSILDKKETYTQDVKLMEDYLDLLENKGCLLTERNFQGWSPIQIALQGGNIEFLKIALKRKFTIAPQKAHLTTELHYVSSFLQVQEGESIFKSLL